MESITNRKILDCLLGKLPEDKENDFLALCFSSDENAEKYDVVCEDLIESYLRGELSNDDKNRFETHFLLDFHHQELLEFAKIARSQLSENRQLEASAKATLTERSFSFGNLLIPVGVCASVLLVGLLIWQVAARRTGSEIAEVKTIPTVDQNPQTSTTPSPTANVKTLPSPTSSETPKSTQTPKPSETRNPKVTETPNPTIETPKTTQTPKPSESPNTKASENPILIFALPLIAKGGNNSSLKITKYTKQVILQTPKPFKEFAKYEVSLQKDGKPLWKNEFEKFSPNSKNQIDISIPSEKFQSGNLKFIIIGKNADGSSEELKGTERFFKVETVK